MLFSDFFNVTFGFGVGVAFFSSFCSGVGVTVSVDSAVSVGDGVTVSVGPAASVGVGVTVSLHLLYSIHYQSGFHNSHHRSAVAHKDSWL